jgi:hypothetical protein
MAPKIKMTANLVVKILLPHFMHLHSLKQGKREKIVLNSKWRQNPRWMLKLVSDYRLQNFVFFKPLFCISFLLLLQYFYRNIFFFKNSKWRWNLKWIPRMVFDIASTETRLFQNVFFLFAYTIS